MNSVRAVDDADHDHWWNAVGVFGEVYRLGKAQPEHLVNLRIEQDQHCKAAVAALVPGRCRDVDRAFADYLRVDDDFSPRCRRRALGRTARHNREQESCSADWPQQAFEHTEGRHRCNMPQALAAVLNARSLAVSEAISRGHGTTAVCSR